MKEFPTAFQASPCAQTRRRRWARFEASPTSTIKDIIIFQPPLQHLSFPATGMMMTLGLIEKAEPESMC